MVIALFLLMFSAIAGSLCLYRQYRKKVPNVYAICVDEYPPFDARYFTCDGRGIALHEALFLWVDLLRRNKLGFERRHEYIQKDGTPLADTEANRLLIRQYYAELAIAHAGSEGEIDADRDFMARIPYAFRRTYFAPKGHKDLIGGH